MPTIRQNLTTINRTPGNRGRDWIVVHNVGTAPTYAGAAEANTIYFAGAYRDASAHIFIDDGDVLWQAVDFDDTAWSVGDAASRNGCYNSNSLNVEVCGDAEFTGARRQNLRWIVRYLMGRYGIDANHVIRHWDVTYKSCPAYYAGIYNQAWNDLHAYITGDYEMDENAMNTLVGKIWGYDYGKTAPGGNLYNTLVFEHTGMLRQLNAQVAALTETVKVLATTKGADPDTIANEVSDAVAKKLSTIELKVTTE